MSLSTSLTGVLTSLWNAPGVQRGLKVAGAGVVAFALAFIAGPQFVGLVGTQNAYILGLILTPILSGLEKHFTLKRAEAKKLSS